MGEQGREGKEKQTKKKGNKKKEKHQEIWAWMMEKNKVGSCKILFQESKMLDAINEVLQQITIPAALLNIHLEQAFRSGQVSLEC